MKRTLFVFALVCVLVAPAGAALADTVQSWGLGIEGSITNVAFANGDVLADVGLFYEANGGRLSIALEPDSVISDPYNFAFVGLGRMFSYGEISPDETFLKGTFSFNFNLQPDQNTSISLSLSMQADFYFYWNPEANDEGVLALPLLANENYNSADVARLVYNGMIYEFSLNWSQDFTYFSGHDPEFDAAVRNALGLDPDTILIGFRYPSGTASLSLAVDLIGPASAVPVPAAVWLMGTGLAGLVALKRRQRA